MEGETGQSREAAYCVRAPAEEAQHGSLYEEEERRQTAAEVLVLMQYLFANVITVSISITCCPGPECGEDNLCGT